MEKALSPEEKIRRAEENYYRKKQLNNSRTATLNVNSKKDYRLLKKIIIQILICMAIYWGFSLAKNNEDLFFKDIIVQARQITTYDMDFNKIIEDARNYINSFGKTSRAEEEKKQNEANATIEETLSATSEESSQEEKDTKKENNSNAQEEKTEEQKVEEVSSISQMEQDALYIKKKYSIIKPLKGTITSRFGLRSPSTPTVPTYHTGIDIAANEGTVFVSAIEGTVELVSSKGDYRKSYKNNKWRCHDFICTLQNYLC